MDAHADEWCHGPLPGRAVLVRSLGLPACGGGISSRVGSATRRHRRLERLPSLPPRPMWHTAACAARPIRSPGPLMAVPPSSPGGPSRGPHRKTPATSCAKVSNDVGVVLAVVRGIRGALAWSFSHRYSSIMVPAASAENPNPRMACSAAS